MNHDYRELVIMHFAAENAELRERALLVGVYREMAKEAIEQLHDQLTEVEYLRRRVAALIDENRALTETVTA